MNTEQIIELQKAVGTVPDGFWGQKSIAACKKHLRSLMPDPNPWPATGEGYLKQFYGKACDEDRLISLPAPVPMYYEGTKIKTIRCHKLVADSLGRALTAAYEAAPNAVAIYDGCYNCRNVAGSNSVSLHARGAAIDLDAASNGSREHWPTSADMPLVVMEAFAREGWLSGGAFWGRDAMHFQATR